jgi:hypothetical protein
MVAKKQGAKKPVVKKAAKKVTAPSVPTHPLMLNEKDWNKDLVMNHLCDQLATTSNGIGTILKIGFNGNSLPSYSSIMAWIDCDSVLLDRYARAKEAQADFMADEILDIADDATNDWMERKDKDERGIGWMLNGEHVQRSRLRIESRKWLASKLKPKKYGDKTTIAGDAENPLAVLTMDQITTNPTSRIKIK